MSKGRMSNAAECLRFMIYTINLIMLVFSFALIVACGTILTRLDILIELLGQDTAWIIVAAIMGTAVIIFLVSLLGCCGAMKEKTCMLKTYIAIMFVLLLVLVTAAGLAYWYKDPARDTVQEHLMEKMKDYNPTDNNTAITTFWNGLQSQVLCCGIDNATDWSQYCTYYMNNSTTGHLFPDSCLPQGKMEPYHQGCLDKAESLMHSNLWLLVGIIAGCAAAMVLAMCCVCKLVRTINQYEEFVDTQNSPW